MTKIQTQLDMMQTQQGVLFRDVIVVKKRLGSMQAFFQEDSQVWFGRFAVPSALLCWKQYTSCCRKDEKIQKKWVTHRIGL